MAARSPRRCRSGCSPARRPGGSRDRRRSRRLPCGETRARRLRAARGGPRLHREGPRRWCGCRRGACCRDTSRPRPPTESSRRGAAGAAWQRATGSWRGMRCRRALPCRCSRAASRPTRCIRSSRASRVAERGRGCPPSARCRASRRARRRSPRAPISPGPHARSWRSGTRTRARPRDAPAPGASSGRGSPRRSRGPCRRARRRGSPGSARKPKDGRRRRAAPRHRSSAGARSSRRSWF